MSELTCLEEGVLGATVAPCSNVMLADVSKWHAADRDVVRHD